MRQVNTDFAGDPEYEEFLVYTENKAYATAKSYKTSYRKLRNLLGKPIRETAQETLVNAVKVAIENINSQQALVNIGIICREQFEPKVPVETFASRLPLERWPEPVRMSWGDPANPIQAANDSCSNSERLLLAVAYPPAMQNRTHDNNR